MVHQTRRQDPASSHHAFPAFPTRGQSAQLDESPEPSEAAELAEEIPTPV